MDFFYQKNAPFELEYPLTKWQVNQFPINTEIVNPFFFDNRRVKAKEIDGVAPLMPGDAGFDAEFIDVVSSVALSKKRVSFLSEYSNYKELVPSGFIDLDAPFIARCLSSKYGIRTTYDLGRFVQNDYPTQVLTDLALYLIGDGAKIRKELFAQKNYQVFTDGIVLLSHALGWAVHSVSPTAFAFKYLYGRPRPEEVAAKVVNGEYEIGEFKTLFDSKANAYNIKRDPRTFTIYEEGSPNHPSYPAMHSAVAAMGLLFPVLFDLTPSQEDECRRTAINLSWGRTYAGVHYSSDNLFGLQIGEYVIEKILPMFLTQFGGIRDIARDIIKAKKNEWLL